MPIKIDNISNIKSDKNAINVSFTQKSYVSSSGALKDVGNDKLDISKQDYHLEQTEKTGLGKWTKATIALGTVSVLGLGAFLTHGKIKSNKLKQSAQEVGKLSENKEILKIFSTTNHLDSAIIGFNPETFGKNGIPLKYSRNSFLSDLKTELDILPKEQRKQIEAKFDIQLNPTNFNEVGVEIERIPRIPSDVGTSEAEQKISKIIKKFTQENETLIENPETKKVLDMIIQEFPEFTAIVGKKQHRTHQYSVDVHTIKNLQDNLQNPRVQSLDSESQLVLKYSTILHDLGKQFISDVRPDEGHAKLSAKYTKHILERMDLSPKIKSRILNQVEHHHWFKDYNMGATSAKDVANLFKTKEDVTIAEIMAHSDLKNVNDNFHLKCMGLLGRPNDYDVVMNSKFAGIDKVIN